MKKLLLSILATAVVTLTTHAQTPPPADSSNWKLGGVVSLTFSQVALDNWQAGGENSISGNFLIKYSADWQKGDWLWDNDFEAAIGATQLGERDIQKTDDRFELSTKFARILSEKWDANVMGTFRSQFTEGFKYEDDTLVGRISHFMAPGYVFAGIGFTYKPAEWFHIDLSPATAKMTFVTVQELADNGDYGVEAAEYDTNGVKTKDGKNFRFELGGYAKISIKKEIVENVTFETKADFFSNYLENPQNIDITWDVLVVMKVNKWLSCNVTTNLIYDDDINIVTGTYSDGTEKTGPRTQFKETLGIGLTANF